jgi:hypothetical protein
MPPLLQLQTGQVLFSRRLGTTRQRQTRSCGAEEDPWHSSRRYQIEPFSQETSQRLLVCTCLCLLGLIFHPVLTHCFPFCIHALVYLVFLLILIAAGHFHTRLYSSILALI